MVQALVAATAAHPVHFAPLAFREQVIQEGSLLFLPVSRVQRNIPDVEAAEQLSRRPAEEIFWRGYVQRTLSKRWNPNAGFVVATLIYALVSSLR